MRLTVLAASALVAVASSTAQAQSDLAGRHQYPQFRTFSGLPGGGYGVLARGRPSIDGAAALATPIGYTLSSHGSVSFFNTGEDLNPFNFDGGGAENRANGSLAAMFGSSLAGFHGSVGVEILSSAGDSVLNFQISPPLKGPLGFAVGVQDLDGGGGAAGTHIPGDHDRSRSFYGVGTYDLGHRSYVSLGTGERRFHGVFGNASTPIGTRVRALIEYDAFNWNGGVVYNTGRWRFLEGKAGSIEANVFAGLVRAKYATVGLTLTL